MSWELEKISKQLQLFGAIEQPKIHFNEQN